jgi:hypothetical protein
MPDAKLCRTCGSPLIQKSRSRLWIVGLLMLVAAVTGYRYAPALVAVAIVLGLTGAYLIAWATLGRALWCRECKRFPIA